MKLEKKILICNILVRVCGAITGAAIFKQDSFYSILFLAITGATMEIKDYLVKKTNVQ